MSIPWSIGPRKSNLARTNEALARLGDTVHGITSDLEKRRALKAHQELARQKLFADALEARRKALMEQEKESGRNRRALSNQEFTAEQQRLNRENQFSIAELGAASREKVAGLRGGGGNTSTYAQKRSDLDAAISAPFDEKNPLYVPLMGVARDIRNNSPNITLQDPGFAKILASKLLGGFSEMDPILRGMIGSYFIQNIADIDAGFLNGVPKTPGALEQAAAKTREILHSIPFMGGNTAAADATSGLEDGAAGMDYQAMTPEDMLRSLDLGVEDLPDTNYVAE